MTKNQFALKSWWPLTSTYEQLKCGENYGRWTDYNEAEYQKRLDEISRGAQPLAAGVWRDYLRGHNWTRHLKQKSSKYSTEFFDSINIPFLC